VKCLEEEEWDVEKYTSDMETYKSCDEEVRRTGSMRQPDIYRSREILPKSRQVSCRVFFTKGTSNAITIPIVNKPWF
jgi:hypothetical protein